MFLMMALSFFIFQNELIAGVASILVLIPYYMVLFLSVSKDLFSQAPASACPGRGSSRAPRRGARWLR